MHVTLVAPFGVLAGSERYVLALVDGGLGCALDAVLLGDGPFRAALERRGVPVEVLEVGRRPVDVARATRPLVRHLRSVAPDVIWANGVKAALPAVAAGRLLRTPVVWVKHDFSYDRIAARPLGMLATTVVGSSAAVAAPTGRRDRVVIPPPLPPDAPAPTDAAEEHWSGRLGRPLPHPAVAMLGRLVPFKGVDVAIRALAEESAAAWHVIVVGDDDRAAPGESARLERLAATYGVQGRVWFTGEVPDAGHWLAPMDAVAVLTRRSGRSFGREGFSLTALEALRAGVPLVGARSSPEVARMAAAAGITVDPTDPRAVAAALRRVAAPDVRARFAEAGRRLAADHPTRAAAARALGSVLRTAAGGG